MKISFRKRKRFRKNSFISLKEKSLISELAEELLDEGKGRKIHRDTVYIGEKGSIVISRSGHLQHLVVGMTKSISLLVFYSAIDDVVMSAFRPS